MRSTCRALIERQIQQGINGLAPCGAPGESAPVSHAEQERAIEICMERAAGRGPVVAGAGPATPKSPATLPGMPKRSAQAQRGMGKAKRSARG